LWAVAGLLVAAALGIGLLVRDAPSQAQEALWLRQFGSGGHDAATGVAVDGSGVVVVGWTSGALASTDLVGPRDAFVQRYTSAGKLSWQDQFGTAGSDVATAVAVGPDDAVYVVGQVAGSGQPGATPFFAFVRKYAADGSALWAREFGAEGASATTTAASVAVDATGAVYVAGWVFGSLTDAPAGGQDDAFVSKYESDGTEVWTHQLGGAGHDLASAVSVDRAGDIYLAVQSDQTSGDVGSTLVRTYRSDGSELWSRTIGSVNDVTIAVTVDGGGAIYQVGEAFPAERVHSHAQGNHRGTPFVRRYAPDGRESWTRPLGAGALDAVVELAVDTAGRVYVAGHTSRGAGTARADPRSIAFVRTIGPGGAVDVLHRFASIGHATGTAIAVGSGGDLYAVGWTRGALPGVSASGPTDAFIGKVRL
jgi:hypothetical protein